MCWICCNGQSVKIACRKNLSLSLTARTDRGLTHYEHGGGRSWISIDGDHRCIFVGALRSELGSSGHGRHRRGNDLGEVEVSKWWNTTPDRGRLRDGG